MFFLWMRDHPKLTRPATPFPTRRSSDLVREALAECLSKSPDRRDGNAFCRGGRPVGSYLESRASGDSAAKDQGGGRSEEHTSELQSLMRISYAVFCLHKKTAQNMRQTNISHIHKQLLDITPITN